MVLWAKLLLVGGASAAVSTGVTAISAKKYWKKRYEKENQFLIDKNAELKDAVADQEAVIKALKEDNEAMTQILSLGQKDIKDADEPDDPEYVDYSKIRKTTVKPEVSNAVKPVEHEKAYILAPEDVDGIDPDDIVRGVYYKGSDDYVGDDEDKPISKKAWMHDSPFCDIHDELKKAKTGSIVNVMTPVGLMYEIDVEGEKYGSD